MKKLFVLFITTVAAVTLIFSSAFAGGRGEYGHREYSGGYHQRYSPPPQHHEGHRGSSLGNDLAVIGVGAVALGVVGAVGSLFQPPPPRIIFVEPPPQCYQRVVVGYTDQWGQFIPQGFRTVPCN